MSNVYAALMPNGMGQGDLHQMLYDMVYAYVNSGGGSGSSDFTVGIQDKAGNWTGAGSDTTRRLFPNGHNQTDLVQIIYELVVGMIDNDANATEADFTGQIANAAGTLTGGTTSRLYWILYNGIAQGKLANILYQIAECMIDDVAAYSSSDFTLDVQDESGNMAGVTG